MFVSNVNTEIFIHNFIYSFIYSVFYSSTTIEFQGDDADFPKDKCAQFLLIEKYQKPHVFGSKVIYYIQDHLRALRY